MPHSFNISAYMWVNVRGINIIEKYITIIVETVLVTKKSSYKNIITQKYVGRIIILLFLFIYINSFLGHEISLLHI